MLFLLLPSEQLHCCHPTLCKGGVLCQLLQSSLTSSFFPFSFIFFSSASKSDVHDSSKYAHLTWLHFCCFVSSFFFLFMYFWFASCRQCASITKIKKRREEKRSSDLLTFSSASLTLCQYLWVEVWRVKELQERLVSHLHTSHLAFKEWNDSGAITRHAHVTAKKKKVNKRTSPERTTRYHTSSFALHSSVGGGFCSVSVYSLVSLSNSSLWLSSFFLFFFLLLFLTEHRAFFPTVLWFSSLFFFFSICSATSIRETKDGLELRVFEELEASRLCCHNVWRSTLSLRSSHHLFFFKEQSNKRRYCFYFFTLVSKKKKKLKSFQKTHCHFCFVCFLSHFLTLPSSPRAVQHHTCASEHRLTLVHLLSPLPPSSSFFFCSYCVRE